MEDKIWDCIIKRLTGTETTMSKKLLDTWLSEDGQHSLKYEETKALWELSNLLAPVEDDISFTAIKERITDELPKAVKPSKKNSWYAYGIAASLIGALLGITFYTYFAAPKESTAVHWLSQTAAQGKTKHFILPDSSEIWLNSGSKIWYANQFNTLKVRSVKLTGEAYFKVKHIEAHPFVVHSGKLVTTVYGTSFSIRAYLSEPNASVAVNSGKVGVASLAIDQGKNPVMLLPSDKLVYNKQAKSFVKAKISNGDVNAWTKGELIFEETPLNEVFATLSRKFNITIKADTTKYKDCRLSARFDNKPLEVILKTLQLAMNINSSKVNETIYIKGGTVCSKN